MHFFTILMVTAILRSLWGAGVSLDAVGLVSVPGRCTIVEYTTVGVGETKGDVASRVSQIVLREVELGIAPEVRLGSPLVLWRSETRASQLREVVGRISLLPLEAGGWVGAAVASPRVALGQIELWSGPHSLFAATPTQGTASASDSQPVETAHVRYVELTNVHLGDASDSHLSGELDSPAVCNWGELICLFGTCETIGFDPQHDWGQGSRSIWCAAFQGRDHVTKNVKNETITARWICPGIHPTPLMGQDTLVVAYWSGAAENIGLTPRPVRFQCSKNLVEWQPAPNIPDSLPVCERYEIVGTLPSPLIVSQDPRDLNKLRVQRLISGVWTELSPVTTNADGLRLEFPLLLGATANGFAPAVWVESDARWRVVRVSY